MGPLQVDVGLTQASNIAAQPALPLRQLVPANGRVLVSRIQTVAVCLPEAYSAPKFERCASPSST